MLSSLIVFGGAAFLTPTAAHPLSIDDPRCSGPTEIGSFEKRHCTDKFEGDDCPCPGTVCLNGLSALKPSMHPTDRACPTCPQLGPSHCHRNKFCMMEDGNCVTMANVPTHKPTAQPPEALTGRHSILDIVYYQTLGDCEDRSTGSGRIGWRLDEHVAARGCFSRSDGRSSTVTCANNAAEEGSVVYTMYSEPACEGEPAETEELVLDRCTAVPCPDPKHLLFGECVGEAYMKATLSPESWWLNREGNRFICASQQELEGRLGTNARDQGLFTGLANISTHIDSTAVGETQWHFVEWFNSKDACEGADIIPGGVTVPGMLEWEFIDGAVNHCLSYESENLIDFVPRPTWSEKIECGSDGTMIYSSFSSGNCQADDLEGSMSYMDGECYECPDDAPCARTANSCYQCPGENCPEMCQGENKQIWVRYLRDDGGAGDICANDCGRAGRLKLSKKKITSKHTGVATACLCDLTCYRELTNVMEQTSVFVYDTKTGVCQCSKIFSEKQRRKLKFMKGRKGKGFRSGP